MSKSLQFEDYLEEHCAPRPFVELVYSQLKLNQKAREDSINQIFEGVGSTNADGLFIADFEESVKPYLEVDIDSLFITAHGQFCGENIVDDMSIRFSIRPIVNVIKKQRNLGDIHIGYFYPHTCSPGMPCR